MSNKRLLELGDKLDEATSKAVQMAVMAGGNQNAGDSFYLGIRAMIGALNPTAMIVSRHQTYSREEIESKSESEIRGMAMKLLTPEALLFTCMVAARVQTDVDASQGAVQIECGPHIYLEALDACEKVFGKPIDDKLDAALVKAARDCEKGSNLPLEQLLAKRSEAHPSPKAVQ